MTILVTGANGQLGSELRELLCHSRENGNPVKDMLADKSLDPPARRRASCLRGDDSAIFVDRDELDITHADAVNAFFEAHKPDYCINAAAYTNVEKAEDEYEYAHAVNVVGAENIAHACAKHNAILFHISTDFVFDGEKTAPYTEDDEPNPLGAYARTKYEGELVVQEHCPKSFIVRTSWLYSSFGSNFVKTMLRLCAERDELPVVADQYGSPTFAADCAVVLLRMIDYCEQKKSVIPSETRNLAGSLTPVRDDIPFGIYHYANDGEVTWFEFAQKIRELANLSCNLRPIPASEYASKVQRPAYSVLSTKKIQHVFGACVPEWDERVQHCLKDMGGLYLEGEEKRTL